MASGKEWKKRRQAQFKVFTAEGFITPRKFAETSTQLRGFEECHGKSFSISNRASLKFLAFAASDSPKSSSKIAYPERNGMWKTLMVTVQSVNCWRALSLDIKLLKALLNCPV